MIGALSGLYLISTQFQVPNILGINGALLMLPFFTLGLTLKRFELRSPLVERLLIGLLVCYLPVQLYLVLQGIGPPDRESRPSLSHAISLICCAALYFVGLKAKAIAFFGRYSFTIYLYHFYFIVLLRWTFSFLGVSNASILFTAGLTFGLLGPIVIDIVISKFRILATLFLGKRFKRDPSP
jgi:membrane-bound acyltransferase YfiQ involved in biofilm formation